MKNYLNVVIGILIIALFITIFQYPGDEADESLKQKFDNATIYLIVVLTLAVVALFWFTKMGNKYPVSENIPLVELSNFKKT
uniref:Uncharacterized protein n=1 Tax=viral metagenome TaxID=1070528 RepID=A0A6C0JB81_9ZZZZ